MLRSLMLFRVLIAATMAIAVSGCFGIRPKEIAPKPKIVGFPKGNISDGSKREPRLIGKVAMVNDDEHFVLVLWDAGTAPAAGTALKCLKNGLETGVVNVTNERRGAYVTADIVTGSPKRGDQAFQ